MLTDRTIYTCICRPSRAGLYPGLKAWAMVYNRFAVKSANQQRRKQLIAQANGWDRFGFEPSEWLGQSISKGLANPEKKKNRFLPLTPQRRHKLLFPGNSFAHFSKTLAQTPFLC